MSSLPEPTDGWSIERGLQGGGGVSAFVVRARTGDRLIVKIARTEAGHASLDRAAAAQRSIADIEALGSWRTKVPGVRSDGQAGPWRFVVETALTGRPMTLPAPRDPGWPMALQAALDAIDGLHRQTGSTDAASDRRTRWVDQRVAASVALGPSLARHDPAMSRALTDGLARLSTELGRVADAGGLTAGWIHGDFWSANILVDEAGVVSGIVDWDSAEPDELAAQDVFHLVLYARKLRRREALGSVVADLLGGGGTFDPLELATLERACPAGCDMRTTALLYWLRFVESNVRRHPGLGTSERWLGSNVGAVARWL